MTSVATAGAALGQATTATSPSSTTPAPVISGQPRLAGGRSNEGRRAGAQPPPATSPSSTTAAPVISGQRRFDGGGSNEGRGAVVFSALYGSAICGGDGLSVMSRAVDSAGTWTACIASWLGLASMVV